jgi:predicted transglutaminase-like cysteine proteinase
LRDDAAMGRGSDSWVSVPIALLILLTPALVEAAYRFDDGVYLGPAELMADWADTLERARSQQADLNACLTDAAACPPRLRGVSALLDRVRDLPAERQIQVVNRFVNRRTYRRDRGTTVLSEVAGGEVYLPSRWSTLVEFFHRGGDCQDYATSKYQLLRLLGVPADDLRVVVVYDRAARAYHAVLAVRQDDDSGWLLDSDNRIYRGIPFGYRFVYALNENAVWDHETPNGLTDRSDTEEEPT